MRLIPPISDIAFSKSAISSSGVRAFPDIVAGRLNAARKRFAGVFKSADVVALPAMNADGRVSARVFIAASVSIPYSLKLFLGQMISMRCSFLRLQNLLVCIFEYRKLFAIRLRADGEPIQFPPCDHLRDQITKRRSFGGTRVNRQTRNVGGHAVERRYPGFRRPRYSRR